MRHASWIGIGVVSAVVLGGACAASNGQQSTGGAGGSGGASASASSASKGSGGATVSSTDTVVTVGVGGSGTGGGCAQFTAAATQAPTAMLIVVDMSASMNTNNKWGTAQLAVVNAIDTDAFDTLSLGLLTFPTSFETGPACVFNIPVSCGTSALPVVPIGPTGTMKSNASSGVRHDIYQYLANHHPLSNLDDGAPIYDSLANGYAALKSVSNVEKRILVLITDGGFSCTSLSSPQRPAYLDGNGCPDWEEPDSVNALIQGANTDAAAPIDTFIVGVPGSDSTGQKQGPFDTAPYSMKLALSTYAVSGSPTTVDPACDATAMFTQAGAAPAMPCHIDLTTGNFDPNALAGAIEQIRGKALGCTYDLPAPPQGMTIDPTLVNVTVTTMGTTTTIPKRSDPNDMCATDPGCWDYDAMMRVTLIGAACSDVKGALDASVDVEVGCKTILK